MKYTSARAFRQALDQRLNDIWRMENIPLVRLRKQVAFERFMARLQYSQPDTWILKGGLAMQLRLGNQARTTKDIDLLNQERSGHLYDELVKAVSIDLGDMFTFEIGNIEDKSEGEFGGQRYQVTCLLDGREYEVFHVDIGTGDLLLDRFDHLEFESVLGFAGIEPTTVACYPIINQIAEKFHALTRKYGSGESSRAKDMVDILLLAKMNILSGEGLARAMQSTFQTRDTHPLSSQMPKLPQTLFREYNRLARELELEYASFESAEEALDEFLNPVLSTPDPGIWHGEEWIWKKLTNII